MSFSIAAVSPAAICESTEVRIFASVAALAFACIAGALRAVKRAHASFEPSAIAEKMEPIVPTAQAFG